jgi:hypothetical protein
MSNMPKLSKRASDALDILADGGKFRYGLERNSYTGREQFQWRLQGAHGGTIKGFGHSTYHEIADAGFAFRRVESGFTGSAAYYHLDKGA